mmetsp:Transcript_14368/g.45208  ORF Transcript_14368/g.45208 Transcript_14368/m.45208 type:complete len:299 (+) Transcript_14368:695-1591(+)
MSTQRGTERNGSESFVPALPSWLSLPKVAMKAASSSCVTNASSTASRSAASFMTSWSPMKTSSCRRSSVRGCHRFSRRTFSSRACSRVKASWTARSEPSRRCSRKLLPVIMRRPTSIQVELTMSEADRPTMEKSMRTSGLAVVQKKPLARRMPSKRSGRPRSTLFQRSGWKGRPSRRTLKWPMPNSAASDSNGFSASLRASSSAHSGIRAKVASSYDRFCRKASTLPISHMVVRTMVACGLRWRSRSATLSACCGDTTSSLFSTSTDANCTWSASKKANGLRSASWVAICNVDRFSSE